MPYRMTSSKLEEFIAEALDNIEIQDGVNQAELEKEFLASNLREKASEIWEAAAKEIEAYDQLENTREAKLAELHGAGTVKNDNPSPPWGLVVGAGAFGSMIPLTFLIGGQLTAAVIALILLVVVVGALVILILYLEYLSRRLDKRGS